MRADKLFFQTLKHIPVAKRFFFFLKSFTGPKTDSSIQGPKTNAGIHNNIVK